MGDAPDLELAPLHVLFAQAFALLQSLALGPDARPPGPGRHGQSRGAGRDHPSLERRGAAMFLGVDGGGTKTAYALVDAGGTLAREPRRRERRSPGGRHRCAHARGSSRASRDALPQARRRPRATSTYAFLGLPAYGEDGAMTAALDAHARRDA